MKATLGKILYSALFCLLLPGLLVLWENSIDYLPTFAPIPVVGWVFVAIGSVLMIIAMLNLWMLGDGLPMNAYPPKRLVTEGVYNWLKHPIYVGFCLAIAGMSIVVGSAAGLFLITPIMALACLALVEGYEAEAIESHFGPRPLPADSLFGRFQQLLVLWIFWLIIFEFIVWMEFDTGRVDLTPFEWNWPVIGSTFVIYTLIYPFVMLVPFALSAERFSSYYITAWRVVIAGLFLELLVPFKSSFRMPSGDFFGDWILWQQSLDSPAASFPSFHVLWALLTAWALQEKSGWRIAGWILALLISISCVTTGLHSVADVAAACILFALVLRYDQAASWFHRWCSDIANSWKAWEVGGIRIISHVFYSGLAGFAAALMLAQFTSHVWDFVIIVLAALAGSMLWGQYIEGSKAMLRPLGYYGALTGGFVAMLVLWWLRGVTPVYWLAVFAMATPVTQAIGRLRCLVQGCCHGRLNPTGICVTNPHSRVSSVPSLVSKTIFNTQGFSIVSNLIIAAILWRVQFGNMPSSLIAGLYFILSGAARFVEEHYRGEPQTRIIGGLRLYQWFAIVSMVVGAFITTLPGEPLTLSLQFDFEVLGAAVVCGLAWGIGMSIDFPRSAVPFSRLTG